MSVCGCLLLSAYTDAIATHKAVKQVFLSIRKGTNEVIVTLIT